MPRPLQDRLRSRYRYSMTDYRASRVRIGGADPKQPNTDAYAGASSVQSQSGRPRTLAMWLLLIGILVIPAGLDIHLSGDGLKFTPGRAMITLLLAPALATLARPPRRLIVSDLLILLTALWMVGSRLPEDGLNQSAAASALELFGGYFVGRAFFFGPRALAAFLRIFKIVISIVIMLAVLDPLFGKNVVQTIVASLVSTPGGVPNQTRFGIIRASSTIEMAELYGTVCCVAGSIFLYLETMKGARLRWAAFAFFGCALSLSSGPLLAFVIVVCFFFYDQLLENFNGRWKVVSLTLALFLLIVFASTERPISWVVEHMTLDPSTAYFRLYVFDYVIEQINLKPLLGWGFAPVGTDDFLSTTTVDCVWLVNAARYGIPMIALFFAANLMSFVSFTSKGRSDCVDEFMRKAGTGFTQAIVMFILVGATVHFWNATWQFWSVCLGIRGAIKEWNSYAARRAAREPGFAARGPKFGSALGHMGPFHTMNRFAAKWPVVSSGRPAAGL
jgi:hypothetical protein